MSRPDTLGDQMKAYEQEARQVLPRRSLSVVRVDGQAFHTYTRGLERPFDARFADDMDAVALALAQDVPGAVLAFVQSDEASVVFHDYATTTTQPWLGGVAAKVVSLTAARATVTMATRRPPTQSGRTALFDSRVFTVPDPEAAAAYLVWRQRDAVRNSISMAAQAHFSHRALQGVHTGRMLEMLSEAGTDWSAYPDGFRRGRVAVRREFTEPVTWAHTRTQDVTTTVVARHRWVIEPAPDFTTDPDGWLRTQVLPGRALNVT